MSMASNYNQGFRPVNRKTFREIKTKGCNEWGVFRADRLTALMQDCGLSQSELGRRVGVSQATIWKLASEPSQGSKHLHKIAHELGTTAAYLMGETDDATAGAVPAPTPIQLAAQLGMRMIPDVDIVYSMGGGSYVEEYVTEKKVPFRQDWLDRVTGGRPSDVFLTRGDGDSMLPTILDGDDVLVDRAQNVIDRQDRIWALGYGELAQIKRVRRLPSGMFQLNSDNPVISPIEATEDELHVVGRVVWIGRKM
jgi:phage repressor protein C with HTH and peptisase S24 domain